VETFKHLKGVVTGDVGPKHGYTSKDNGWARFDQVRIPCTVMLMGISSVDKQGSFGRLSDPRVLYIVMMNIRMILVKESNFILFPMLKIAVRYNSVRRQFKTYNGSKDERKILDYQTQQHTLILVCAQTYHMNVVGQYMKGQYFKMMERIPNNDYSLMDINHHLLSGLRRVSRMNLFLAQKSADGAVEGQDITLSLASLSSTKMYLPFQLTEAIILL
jgi:acyl-CoA oxidase